MVFWSLVSGCLNVLPWLDGQSGGMSKTLVLIDDLTGLGSRGPLHHVSLETECLSSGSTKVLCPSPRIQVLLYE